MTTLQEQFEKDFPNKRLREIADGGKYWDSNFTNYDLDLSEYVSLEKFDLVHNKITSINLSRCKELKMIILSNNNFTSVGFLNPLPNPEKLEGLYIFNNNIQPTNIEVFSKFINLKELKIGTTEGGDLIKGKRNLFYGSLKSYQNLIKLQSICIEATDVNEGLEYLPESLVRKTQGGIYGNIECSSHDTNAKCSQIQNELRPFNYDLGAWQLAHPKKNVN